MLKAHQFYILCDRIAIMCIYLSKQEVYMHHHAQHDQWTCNQNFNPILFVLEIRNITFTRQPHILTIPIGLITSTRQTCRCRAKQRVTKKANCSSYQTLLDEYKGIIKTHPHFNVMNSGENLPPHFPFQQLYQRTRRVRGIYFMCKVIRYYIPTSCINSNSLNFPT